MALINCPECGAQISDRALRCIKCGYPLVMKSQHLKFAIILGIIMLILGIFFFFQQMPQ